MRILQIVPSVSLVYGGPSQMVLGLAAALANEGVEVTLLTTDSNGDVGQPPLDVTLEEPIKQDGYEIIYFRCSPFRRYKFSTALLSWLGNHSQEYDLAHIHALFSPISTAAATVARFRSLPYILRPLGTLDPADLRKKKRLKALYGSLLERPNLAGAAGVHFTSVQEAKISERFGAITKDFIVPLGVKLPEFTPEIGQGRSKLGIEVDKPILLFMSRIDPKKGLDLLLPGLIDLLNQGEEFHFVLAGTNPQDPEYEKKIQEQIQGSELANHSTITGFVGGEFKLALLQDADLFILPSYYENFGIAVAEAMAAGTAVVISDQVHIWQEVRDAEAGWVTKCEVKALTETIKLALHNREKVKNRGEKARSYATSNYSWQAIAQQMIKVYRGVL